MNYPQFFAILSNQMGRFAPEAKVPEEFERVLTELCKAALSSDVDQALVEPLVAALGPKYEKLLWGLYEETRAPIKARIALLDEAQAKLTEERNQATREAEERALAAARRQEEDRRKLGELTAQVQALESRLAELKNLQ
jgi:non-ribosomal peptide synthetase component F